MEGSTFAKDHSYVCGFQLLYVTAIGNVAWNEDVLIGFDSPPTLLYLDLRDFLFVSNNGSDNSSLQELRLCGLV